MTAVAQNVNTSTPANTVTDELPTARSTMPSIVIRIVGTSTTSIRMSWARRSCMMAGGKRTQAHYATGDACTFTRWFAAA